MRIFTRVQEPILKYTQSFHSFLVKFWWLSSKIQILAINTRFYIVIWWYLSRDDAETGLCSRSFQRNNKKWTTLTSNQPVSQPTSQPTSQPSSAEFARLPFGTIFSTKLMLISGRRDVDREHSTGFHVRPLPGLLAVCAWRALRMP